MNNLENKYFHEYDRRLELLLQRINPAKYGAREIQTNGKWNGKPYRQKNLTPKNVELLSKFYVDRINEGLSKPRVCSLLEQTSTMLEWLNKDWDKVTIDDIKEVVNKIRTANFTEHTKCDYLGKLKLFDKWYNGGEEYSPLTKFVKTTLKNKYRVLPTDLIQPEEAYKMIEATTNARDKALIHLLWETGARIGEIGNIKFKDIQFTGGEGTVNLYGKTGSRRVLILESVRNLKTYISLRPNYVPDDFVFVNFGTSNNGQPVAYRNVSIMLQENAKRIGLKKRIYPHLFRHSRASYLASQGLNESTLCAIFGWALGSKQVRTYIHLSGTQVQNAYKELYGIKKPEETETKLIKCQVCGEINHATNTVCENCHNPLTIQGALKLKKENEYLQEATEVLQQIHSKAFELARQGVPLNEAEEQAKVLVAEAFAKKLKEEQKIKALA